MFNIYSVLKQKKKDLVTSEDFCNLLVESLSGMFVYKCESDEFLESMLNHKLELWLRAYGKLGFAMGDDGKLYFGRVEFTGGNLNKYGWLDKVTIFTLNGESKQFDVYGDNVVIMFNNALGAPELNALRYADKLAEVDKSMDCGIINSRYTQMVLVKNEKVKRAIDAAVADIKIGEPIIVDGADLIGQDILKPNGDAKSVELFNITDVTNSDKLQYLTHFHDDLMREFYQMYGIDTNNTAKMAQQSVDEIQGSVGRSFIIPNQNYNWRLRALNEIEQKFGIKIEIAWGESWGIEMDKYKADVDNTDDPYSEDANTEDDSQDNDNTGEDGDNNDNREDIKD